MSDQLQEDGETSNRDEGSLPQEIIYGILLRLPAKSLCRFKCVSKLWLSTISDSQFVSAHLDLSASRPNLLISFSKTILDQDGSNRARLSFTADYPESAAVTEQGRSQPLLAAFHGSILDGSDWLGPSQSSGGLICLIFDWGLKICNPITGETIKLSPPALEFESPRTYHFGYDPVGKKHKVLSIIMSHDIHYIITLGEDAEWRKLESNNEPPFHQYWFINGDFINGATVCINGVIYYPALCEDAPDSINKWVGLIAFDLRSETFEVIPAPSDILDGGLIYLMKSGDGCVAIVKTPDYHDDSQIFIYTLKKDRSWSHQRFPVREEWQGWIVSVAHLRGFSHKGELLYVLKTSCGKPNLYFYDVEKDSISQTEVLGLYGCEDARFIEICDHMESLQSLEGLRTANQPHGNLQR